MAQLITPADSQVDSGPREQFGQPLPKSHGHLMAPNELTPGITAEEYATRRRKLIEKLPTNSLVIVFGSRLQFKATHVFYPFHQDSNFLYLTGFNEPDAVLVMEKSEHLADGYRSTLFALPKDPEVEKWEGPRTGLEGIRTWFGMDQAFTYHSFEQKLTQLLQEYFVGQQGERAGYASQPLQSLLRTIKNPLYTTEDTMPGVYVDIPDDQLVYRSPQAMVKQLLDQYRLIPHKVSPFIHELRLIKSPAELAVLKQSSDISNEAFRRTMQESTQSTTEHQIMTTFTYHCCRQGAEELAYVPVVAGGSNALALHYVRNDQRVSPQDFVLLDGGASYRHYASDVTRTWPIGGTFSPAQADLYQAVLNVQKASIAQCTEATRVSLNYIHFRSAQMLRQELLNLGWDVSQKEVDSLLYPHHVGHYLGIDVHDTLDVSRNLELQAGMVVTIEPGVYVPFDDRFSSHFQGLGIRIEDNIEIGKTEPHNLNESAPKEIHEIESVCRG
ncbi:aminopeptidase [Dispira parvispora]|uniref:Aminopeptidase n=1 Tax=Dispira parvispora TaxID=1520584 RepID=A0A9W8AMA6_9FUNG|nr:aminopeptidase [Dispira parvispora]